MTDKPELLPCPFCGGKAEFNYHDDDYSGPMYHWIECTKCSVTTDTDRHDADDCRVRLAAVWNKREWQVAKSVPDALLAEAQEQVRAVPYYDPSTAEVPPPGHPLQKLGEYLSLILDEDEWATAEQHLLAAWAGFYAKSIPVVGEPVALVAPLDLERIQANNGCFIRLLAGKEAILLSDIPLYTKPTDSITKAELERLRKDAERLDVIDRLAEAYGFEDTLEGYEWRINGPWKTIREAIDAIAPAIAADEEKE